MKKIYLLIFICIAFLGSKAATFTVSITGFPYAYSPSVTTCAIGDQVIIQAQSIHPTAQVDQSTWMASGTTTMTGGWGSKTTTFTFTAVSTGTVYFLCQVHLFKGMIVVNATGINETAAAFLNNYNLFPNPAASDVKVSFGLNEVSTLNIRLFNIAGQEIKTFVSNLNLPMGNYEYNFELPQSIASGNYFIEISSGNRKTTKKLLVSK
ncbi:MAG TPA: T9SS type A sorting domain-containing protein [Bacteroidia bacterium]|jgi:plastocyanin|nr:T9SS type A sorting domain-containing protein [Bacteroidia bacterium]